MAEFHITTCDGGRGGCFQPACKCPCHDGRTNPRGGEAGRSRSDGSQPSNHVEGTGVATRRHPDHLCTVEEARSWANMFGSDTKFGRMALTVIALADEIEHGNKVMADAAERIGEFRKAVITRLAMLSRQIEDAIEELADVAVIDGGHHKQWGIARALEILGYHLTADIDGGIEP